MAAHKNLLLGKLRQSSGPNQILCNKAADEIVKLRKRILELEKTIKELENIE